ncbi:MAG: methyltransferase domain-containing protein [Chthoniobacterales bacterium]|nr:methyltransferase domain-containing protein [Chthoniobacterales bacterium]
MQPKEDREFWNEGWKADIAKGPGHPDADTWGNERDERIMTFLRPYLPNNGGVVAEIGCGSGRVLCRIGRERPVKLVAMDYAPAALDLVQATAKIFNVEVESQLADAYATGLPDRSFDFILSGGLMEHFDDPERILAEMVRLLKPGGAVFAVVVPRKWFSLHRPLHRWLGPQVYRTKHGPEQYVKWLEELGCVDIKADAKGVYPPLFHNLPTAPRRAIERVFRPLDGTWLANRLGYFFLFAGRRPSPSSPR